MTIPRCLQVDLSVSRHYHCISRCVRGAKLLGQYAGARLDNRKTWLQNRLEQLQGIFAVSVGGFSIMDSHLHLLLRLEPEVAEGWSAQQVAQRWFELYPPKGSNRQPLIGKALEELHRKCTADEQWVAERRSRLGSLSWFMKALKEPLARMANKADKCTGAFFEGRFKSIAILDEEALMAVAAYIDLNPVAAGMADTPEESEHTSFKVRWDHVAKQDRLKDLQAIEQGSVAGSQLTSGLEDDLWLLPIEDRSQLDSTRRGLLEGFTLGQYYLLVEYTGRKDREGKAKIASALPGIFERLGSSEEEWKARMAQLQSGKWIGRVFAGSAERLSDAAQKLGCPRLRNLTARSAA